MYGPVGHVDDLLWGEGPPSVPGLWMIRHMTGTSLELLLPVQYYWGTWYGKRCLLAHSGLKEHNPKYWNTERMIAPIQGDTMSETVGMSGLMHCLSLLQTTIKACQILGVAIGNSEKYTSGDATVSYHVVAENGSYLSMGVDHDIPNVFIEGYLPSDEEPAFEIVYERGCGWVEKSGGVLRYIEDRNEVHTLIIAFYKKHIQ